MEKIREDFWHFVDDHIKDDPNRLRLKYHGNTTLAFDVQLAITQIECRKRYAAKLKDTLSRYPHWLFPSVLAGEQSTSDLLAQYHASLLGSASNVIDLTAGLGIDALHFSYQASKVTACEIDTDKAWALRYNITNNQLNTIHLIEGDCQEIISRTPVKSYDTAFIDPARRNADGSRVFDLHDCQPDVTKLVDEIARIADRLVVKLSPMLDITKTMRDLEGIEHIIALGTPTECKELIAIINFTQSEAPVMISAVTLLSGGQSSVFKFATSDSCDKDISCVVPTVGGYIYEPYPSVMKVASFKALDNALPVNRLHPNTNLYFSDCHIDYFPGQAMKIVSILPFASKHIKRLKRDYPKISVTTRNFPMSADKLRAKLGVTEGMGHRLFAVTLCDGSQAMIICQTQHSIGQATVDQPQ